MNLVLIVVYWDDDTGDNSGSAYIFRRDGTGWTEEAKLTASGGAASDYFGSSISDNHAVIGAYGDDDNGNSSGSAYVFRRDCMSWIEEAKLKARDGTRNDEFGRSVSISGDYAVVGAYHDDNGNSSGSTYVYTGFTAVPNLPPVSVVATVTPKSGDGTFDYTICVTSNTDSSQTIDIWMEAFGPGEGHKVGHVAYGKTLLGTGSYSKGGTKQLGENAPLGDYLFVAYVGTYPDGVMDSSSALYTKTTLGKRSLPGKAIPEAFKLSENFPNPFNPTTTIKYDLPSDSRVSLKVYDVLGREVLSLVDGVETAGHHQITLNASNLSSGVCFCRLQARQVDSGQAGDFVETRKLVLMK